MNSYLLILYIQRGIKDDKKIIFKPLLLVLFGCSNDSFPLIQDEAEGSVTKFNNDTHGTYGSTYVPLSSENAVIRNATVFDGLETCTKTTIFIFLTEKFRHWA